tara:strand:- start:1850 stop:2413 length:564 start_codon:yes stop_codon:yes gene_type:complete
MTEDELIEIFGEDFRQILEDLDDKVPDALDELIKAVFAAVTYDVTIFANRIEQQVTRLINQGLSDALIAETLASDLKANGRIFGELKNSVGAAVAELTNQAGRLGMLEEWGSEYVNFMWITVSGHKVCPDCDARGGMIETWDNWVIAGLPGSGWSVCRGYCYCVLDPTDSLSDKVPVPKQIREVGAT